jgi:hypothetical protein
MEKLTLNHHFNTTNYNPSVLRINSHTEKYMDELFVEILLDYLDDVREEPFLILDKYDEKIVN